jgi:DNA helicase HerA-like ATPase
MDDTRSEDWGMQVGTPDLEEVFNDKFSMSGVEDLSDKENICLGTKIKLPLELLYQVMFISGKRGSGKSYTAAVLMEEFERLGLQFVCFDALDAHGYLNQLDGIERIEPKPGEGVNMKKLISKLKVSPKSLIINLSQLPLENQQRIVSEYCEAILDTDMGGQGLMTLFEECQDFVPQIGRPSSYASIVRLCKLGRASGYGVSLISQRPAAVSKEALSQASVYCCHNIINTKDLDALKDQLSFGSDKESIKKILSGITYSKAGEAVMYSPEFFRDDGYIVVGKIDTPRRTEHKGSNIEVKTKFSTEQPTNYYQGDFNTLDYGLTKPIDDFSMGAHNDSLQNDHETVESNDLYKYQPENYDFSVSDELMPMVKFAEKAQNNNNQGVKTIAAIGLLSAGFYTVLRSIGKRK